MRSLALTSAELIWLRSVLHELQVSLPHCQILWVDNQSAAAMAHDLVFHARSKRIEIDYHVVREQLAAGTLDVRYVPALDQVVDVLTKSLYTDRFLYIKAKLHVFDSPS